MPKGLAFLSKKSWHTSKLCNQEKVWIAEQEKIAEEVKIKEISRQIQQEREEEELNRLSGKKSNRLDRGIDWMYQGGGSAGGGKPTAFEEEQKEKEQMDYLLGKEYNPSNVKKGDLAAAESSVGVNMVLTRAAESSSHAQNETSKQKPVQTAEEDWNSNFHLRHEDPMFLVEQQRKEMKRDEDRKKRWFEMADNGNHDDHDSYSSRERHRSNRKKRSRRERDRKSSRDHDRRRDRRSHKKRRKERGRHRHRSRSRSPSSDSYMYESRRNRKDRKHSKHCREDYNDSESSGMRKTSDHYRDKRSQSRDRYDERRERNRYDDERHERNRYDDNSRRKSRSRERSRRSNQVRPSGNDAENDSFDNDPDANDKPIRAGFGLIGASSSSKPLSTSDLGPDPLLLGKKRKEKDNAKSRYRRKDYSDNGNRRSTVTAKQREEALRAMQSDASELYSRDRKGRVSNKELYEEEIVRRKQGSGGNVSFLRDTRRFH